MIFTTEHIDMIRNGEKTETRRIWKRPHVRVGGVYKTRTSQWRKPERRNPRIRVTAFWTEALCCITPGGAIREGGYTLSQYVSLWCRLHGSWNPKQVVYVIRFEVAR